MEANQKLKVNLYNTMGYIKIKFDLDGQTYQLSPVRKGKWDSPDDKREAEKVARWIENDIKYGDFDPTLVKYKPKAKLKIIEFPKPKPELSLQQCWDLYFDYKKPSWKKGEDGTKSTMDYMEKLGDYIHNCSVTEFDALAVRQWFLDNTTESMTKRCLTHINAAVKFAIKHKRISLTSSPFEGMPQELTHHYEIESEPMALSLEEKQKIFEAFKNHRGNWNGRGYTGYSYSYYYPFVKGLFLIGRRPEEICQGSIPILQKAKILNCKFTIQVGTTKLQHLRDTFRFPLRS